VKELPLIITMDIKESLRAKWFYLYIIVFGGLVLILYWLGVTESEVMGFTGVSRLLVTYIQLSIVVLPLFIMSATVRTIVGDRESNVLEYYLSLPVNLKSFYWGKFIGRLISVVFPILFCLSSAVLWALVKKIQIRWDIYLLYCCIVVSLSICFLGIAFLISSFVKRQDTALVVVFLIWLTSLIFMDIVLIGLFIQYNMPIKAVIAISLSNPVQVFRVAALALFDPRLSVMGPSAYVVLDIFGRWGYLVYSICYPLILGLVTGYAGFMLFKRKDLI